MKDIGSVEVAFKNTILSFFDPKRIVSLLYFGTRAFDINIHEDSDYDFFLILDKYDSEDLQKLREIVDKERLKSLNLNINFLYFSDIQARGKENFQIHSVLDSLYEYLFVAKVLIGKNIFKEDPFYLSKEKSFKEFSFKIQEHHGRCDGLYFLGLSDNETYIKLAKYIRNMVKFFLIMREKITIQDMAKLSYEKMFEIAGKNNIFPESIIKKLPILSVSYSGDKDLQKIERLRRLIYEEYLRFCFQNN